MLQSEPKKSFMIKDILNLPSKIHFSDRVEMMGIDPFNCRITPQDLILLEAGMYIYLKFF